MLGEEQVRTFDDVLEVWLALGVDEVCNVRDIDCLGSTTTGHKEIGLDSEVEVVSEISSIGNDFAGCRSASATNGKHGKLTRKLNILLVDEDLVTFWTELFFGKEVDGASSLGQSNQFRSVQSCRIVQDTRTINDSDSLVFAE